MKDQTSKTGKTKGSAMGAKGAACALLGAPVAVLASARPAYAVDVDGPSFNYMITNFIGPGMTLVGLPILCFNAFNYVNFKDDEGPKAKAALAGMVGGGIMAAIGGTAMVMLSMSA